MIHRASRAQRRGLTLLEVIVAMTIFLGSSVVIYQLVAIGNDRALDVQYYSRASTLCQTKLEELKIGAEPLQGTSGQSFKEDDDSKWQYDIDVADGAFQGIKKVRVTVKQDRPDGHTVEVSLDALILDPTMRGSTLDKLGSSSTTSSAGGNSP
jgi:general secretion pathway protein I